MAMPQSMTMAEALDTTGGILRRLYLDKRWRPQTRGRTGFPRFLRWAEEAGHRFKGQELVYEVHHTHFTGTMYGAQEAVLPQPHITSGAKVTIGYGDLERVANAIQYTQETKAMAVSPGAVVDWIAETVRDSRVDVMEARHRKWWQNKNARLATIDGLPTDDSSLHLSGSALTSESVIQFPLQNESPAMLRKGMTVHMHNASSAYVVGKTVAHEVWILDIFRGPDGADYTGTSKTGACWICRLKCTAEADLDAAADNYELYLGDHGTAAGTGESEATHGLYGPLSWFFNDAGGGSSTIYGINRETSGNDYFMPTKAREGEADAVFEYATHLVPFTPVISRNRAGDDSELVMCGPPELVNHAENELMANGFTPLPASQASPTLHAHYGFNGVAFHSSLLGNFAVDPDDYAPMNKLWWLKPSSWFVASAGKTEFLPGAVGGIWDKCHTATQFYARWRAHMFGLENFACTHPAGNHLLDHVKADHD